MTKDQRIALLRQALADVVDPIGKVQREMEPHMRLDGAGCYHAMKDPETYRTIAKEALAADDRN